jgi:hypothetical protein
MAVTFKQLLNRALRITGEDEIADSTTEVSDTQHLLIAEMANQIKEEVEAAHNWRALRQTVTVSLASVNSGTITEADERSRVVRIQEPHRGKEVALVWDVTDSSNPFPLHELDLAELLWRREMDPDSSQDPNYFALDNTSGDVLKLEVYPTPSDTRSIKLMLVIPQARLDAADTDDLITNIKVPTRPIEMGLIRYILEERGEELGINSQFSEEKETKALRDAVSLDAAEQGDYNLVPE